MDKCRVCALRYHCVGKQRFDCEIHNNAYYMPDAKAIDEVQKELNECRGNAPAKVVDRGDGTADGYVKCKVSRNERGGYHIFVNGVDIAPYTTKLALNMNVHNRFPTLVVEMPIESFECDELCQLFAKKTIK